MQNFAQEHIIDGVILNPESVCLESQISRIAQHVANLFGGDGVFVVGVMVVFCTSETTGVSKMF